jgi:hypothetical protein
MGTDMKSEVIIHSGANDLTRFAADELVRYMKILFDEDAVVLYRASDLGSPVFYLGSGTENPYFETYGMPDRFETAGRQAVMIRRISDGVMVVSGGSGVAVLWAVYGLAALWGVEFLLHEDVLPEKRAFYLPDADVFEEPIEPLRTWAFPHGLAFGPESWGISDYKSIITQLSKLRFNRIFLQYYPGYPLMDLEYKGIHRSTVSLFFNYHYPITDDMVGREIFDDRSEFWNRDMPVGASCGDMLEAGKKLVHGVMAHAHSCGMECALGILPLEYLSEFAPVIKDPLIIKLLDTETVVPGKNMDVEDLDLFDMALATLKMTLEEYPETDVIAPVMPEFREWVDRSYDAWNKLDQKYGISGIMTYDEALSKALERTEYPGGSQRAEKEVMGDIVALYFYDLFFCERKALSYTCRPDIKVMYMNISEELFPVVSKIIPDGTECSCYVDYTPTRVLKRREALRRIPQDTSFTMYYTIQDDNIGFLPMIATESLDELLKTVRKAGWKGFLSRYWLTSDHDICVNHLANAMWNEKPSNFSTCLRLITAICGEGCVHEMLGMIRELENATVILERDGLGFAFPIPNMVSCHWERNEPAQGMAEVLFDYERALDWAKRARIKSAEKGAWFIDYWIGRISFGIGYLNMTEMVYDGGRAFASGNVTLAKDNIRQALFLALEAGASYAGSARDCSDIASVAVFNEYGIRYLKRKLEELSF